MRVNILLSSANRLSGDRTSSGKSFINMRNNTGPRTDPCGTPLVTLHASEVDPLITTLWL